MQHLNPYQKLQFALVGLFVLAGVAVGVAMSFGADLPPEIKALFGGMVTLVTLLISPSDLAAAIKKASGLPVEDAPPADQQGGFFRLRGLLVVAALALVTVFAFQGGCTHAAPGTAVAGKAETITVQALGALSVTIKDSKGIVDALYAAGKVSPRGYNAFAEVRKKAWLAFLTADDAAQAALAAGQAPEGYPQYVAALTELLKAKTDIDNMLVEFGVLPRPAEVP